MFNGLPMQASAGLHNLAPYPMDGMGYQGASPMLPTPSQSSNGLAGIPGVEHPHLLRPHDLPPTTLAMQHVESAHVDPQLMTYQKDYGGVQNIAGLSAYHAMTQALPNWDNESYFGNEAPSQTSSPAPPPGLASAYVPSTHLDFSHDLKCHDPMGFDGAGSELENWFEHSASGY